MDADEHRSPVATPDVLEYSTLGSRSRIRRGGCLEAAMGLGIFLLVSGLLIASLAVCLLIAMFGKR